MHSVLAGQGRAQKAEPLNGYGSTLALSAADNVSSEPDWISASEFAQRAGIARRVATKALARASRGICWHGHLLEVRRVYGRGGAHGLSYEISVASLPEALGKSLYPIEELPLPPRTTACRSVMIGSRLAVIEHCLQHPLGSSERTGAVAKVAAASGKSERTIRRWVARYEERGLSGLGRQRPSNAGEARMVVSRTFDKALRQAGHSEALLTRLGGEVDAHLKGLWSSRAEGAGWPEIRRLAEFLLSEACSRLNVVLPRTAMRISRRRVEKFAQFRVVNQRRNDRKAFDDAKPRIRLDWTGLAPMERIVADVKHLDVIVQREDGSPAWPKMVGFMDAGTGRVFEHLVLLQPGEGVRQEHIIQGFLAMVADPAWGFPQGLYLDNGSEFGALQKMMTPLQMLNEPGARTIIFARPYNASAKPIESLFARLDRYVFSMLPGYAGPNRMAKKTQTVGHPPRPFGGSWEEFCGTVKKLIVTYNDRPVGGLWGDRSPNSWLQEKVDAGWRPVHVDNAALDATFCDHDSRRVDRGVIRVKGERLTHPALAALPSRTVVDIALPWRRGAPPLFRSDGSGWAYLVPDHPYPANWIEGARESSRRQRSQQRYVSKLERDAPRIDPVALKLRMADLAPAVVIPPSRQIMELGGEAAALSRAPSPASEGSDRESRADLRRAREMALTERLERSFVRDD